MILVWRRWGILVPIIIILGAIGAQYLFQPAGRAQCIFFFVPAAIVLGAGLLLDMTHQANDFFFIPMKYWSVILSLFGVAILFTH